MHGRAKLDAAEEAGTRVLMSSTEAGQQAIQQEMDRSVPSVTSSILSRTYIFNLPIKWKRFEAQFSACEMFMLLK